MERKPTLLIDFDAGETDDITFHAARALKAGETIVSATVTPSWTHGVADVDFAQRFIVPHQVVGTDVIQRVVEPVAGAWYRLRCRVVLSSGRRLVGAAIFQAKSL